ncbi:MAG: hypothetical protein LBG69_00450 [Zoogloeaceae bacterium]|jgi:cation/acetate symporter|nr:hypothetical protein [Zoogloeaceae bacterium]
MRNGNFRARAVWPQCAFLALCVPDAALASARGFSAAGGLSAIVAFFVLFCFALLTARWAAEKSREDIRCHPELRTINGFQNGFALAGSYISVAALLGIPALMTDRSHLAAVFLLGFFVGWPLLSLLFAERLRNLGGYTFADFIARRFPGADSLRAFLALASLAVILPFLAAQLLCAGQILCLLFDLEYWLAVVVAAVLLLMYSGMNGQIAATWLHIVKFFVLACGLLVFAGCLLWELGFDARGLFARALALKSSLAGDEALLARETLPWARDLGVDADARMRFFFFPMAHDVFALYSLALTMLLGCLGLPHVLPRFSAVPNASEARKSALWASLWIGFASILIGVTGLGLAAIHRVNRFLDSAPILEEGGNLAALYMVRALGSDIFMGAFAAVLLFSLTAVSVGLSHSASAAIAHDVYALALRHGRGKPDWESRLIRVTPLFLFLFAVLLALALARGNLALILAFAFSVAASSTAPLLMASLFWRGVTSLGLLLGGAAGLLYALGAGFVPLLASAGGSVFADAQEALTLPTLFGAALCFSVTGVVSLLDRSQRAKRERAGWEKYDFRMATGLKLADSSAAGSDSEGASADGAA